MQKPAYCDNYHTLQILGVAGLKDREKYLTLQDFNAVKKDVKRLWRKMGMLHLRMTNDIDIKNSKPINKEEIKMKLEALKADINNILDNFL